MPNGNNCVQYKRFVVVFGVRCTHKFMQKWLRNKKHTALKLKKDKKRKLAKEELVLIAISP